MTTSQEQGLAAVIEHAIRDVPGVTAVFRAGTLASKIVDAGARLLGITDERDSPVRLESTAEGVRAEIAIGVRADAGTVAILHRVHDVVRGALADGTHGPKEIRITVVHIEDVARPEEVRPPGERGA